MNEITTNLEITPAPRISRVKVAVLVASVIANIALAAFAFDAPMLGSALKAALPLNAPSAMCTNNYNMLQNRAAQLNNAKGMLRTQADADAYQMQGNALRTQYTQLQQQCPGIDQYMSANGNQTSAGNPGLLGSLTNLIGNSMGQTGLTGGDNKLIDGATRIAGDAGVGSLAGAAVGSLMGKDAGKGAMYGGLATGGLSLVNQALSGGTGNSIVGSALGAVGIGQGGGGLVDTLSNTFSGTKSAAPDTPCVLDTKGQPLTIPASSWGNPAAQPLSVGI